MNNLQPLVSIIMPCYNAEEFVAKAVESILSQTYKNIELICIDDCSIDHTLQILKQYEQLDSRVIVVSNPVNMKISASLNIGLQMAHGEYIARMDSDDVSVANRIELQVNYMLSNPNIGICGGQCIVIDAWGNKCGEMMYPLTYEELKATLLFDACFAHPTVLFKREIYERIGGYKEFMPIEDFEYWNRMDSNGVIMTNLDCVLLYYRVHGGNVTSVFNNSNKELKISEVFRLYPSKFYSVEQCNIFNRRFLMGNWSEKTEYSDWIKIESISRDLLKFNSTLDNYTVVKDIIDYHKFRAYFSCMKSSNNSFKVRLLSALKLLGNIATAVSIVRKL